MLMYLVLFKIMQKVLSDSAEVHHTLMGNYCVRLQASTE